MWNIVQVYGWRNSDGSPILPSEDNKIVHTSRSWLSAYLWKLFHYDLIAEPCWKASFIWRIEHGS